MVVRAHTSPARGPAPVADAGAIATHRALPLLAAAFDGAPIGMCLVDLGGTWLRVNEAYCRMFGYRRDELLATTARALVHPDDLGEELDWWHRAHAHGQSSFEGDQRYIARDGSTVWVHTRIAMIPDDDGRPAYTLTLLYEITEQRIAEQARRASEAQLKVIVASMRGAASIKDRDHRYLLVNSAFERHFGRAPGSVVGRCDDEVLPPSMLAVDREGDERVLRTGDLIEQERVVTLDGEDHVYLTVKFPVAGAGRDGSMAVGGIFNDITDRKRREEGLRERLEWTRRIHGAIAEDRLVLYRQPIVDLRSGKVEQHELLVRMRSPGGGSTLIPPGEFLPAAERFDLIGAIDLWVVAQAIELACAGHRVEVNLSGMTISDPERVAAIEQLVLDSGVPGKNLVFEITETAVAADTDAARRFAERLRALGCGFALDDFGVGYGTFTYLRQIPVDYLKIDITFVRHLVRDESDRQVVRAIVGVARDFGMKTIAEGVEDQETVDLLRLMGVDLAQGYWLGRPAPIPDRPTPWRAS